MGCRVRAVTPGCPHGSGASPWSSTCWCHPLQRQQVPCGAALAAVRSLRWLRSCQGCRMEGINAPTCPAQLLPPLEDGSALQPRQNPHCSLGTPPCRSYQPSSTRSDLTSSTFQSICIRGPCPKCWVFFFLNILCVTRAHRWSSQLTLSVLCPPRAELVLVGLYGFLQRVRCAERSAAVGVHMDV